MDLTHPQTVRNVDPVQLFIILAIQLPFQLTPFILTQVRDSHLSSKAFEWNYQGRNSQAP
jgi:hypothetical protein